MPPHRRSQWRRCLLDGADLTGADLAGADLRDTSFKRSEMRRRRPQPRSRGGAAKFVSSGLQEVDFSGADLVQADFTSADLTGAKLVGASLRSARLFQANLRGADLTDAVLEGADLLRTDFSGARWVDGRTICAEGSIDRCHAGAGHRRQQGTGLELQPRALLQQRQEFLRRQRPC